MIFQLAKVNPLDPSNIVFPKLGIDIDVNSDLLNINGFAIKMYGFLIMIGLLLALIYCFKRMKSFGLSSDRAFDPVFGGFIGAIIGARLYYVFMLWDNYKAEPIKIFAFRDGGLAIYGGIIGGLLVATIVAHFRKVKILPFLDLAGMGFLIGQGIGRWGNFFNHEAFGSNTDNIFGMSSGRIQRYLAANSDKILNETGIVVDPYTTVHPCFLYESIWCLIGFAILHFYSKRRKFDGELFLMYLGWYGLGRFFIEGLRTDSLMVGHLRISQLVAGLCVIAAIATIIAVRINIKRNGEYQFYKDTEESKKFIQEQVDAENIAKEKKALKKAKKEETLSAKDRIADSEDQSETNNDNEKGE